MSNIIFVLALLFSIQTFASPTLNKFVAKFPNIKLPKAGSHQGIMPLRWATLKATIHKNQAIQNNDGTYTYTHSDVCTGTTQIPVYDYRTQDGDPILLGEGLQCQSTVEDQPVTVIVWAQAALIHASLFSDELGTDMEIINPTLNVNESGMVLDQLSADDFLGVRGANVPSVVVSLVARDTYKCTPNGGCTPILLENFNATVEFKD